MSIKTSEQIIQELKSSPVFNMSLASKELFHSNFWAWLFEQPNGARYVGVFFADFEARLAEAHAHYPNAGYTVLREHKNMDLRIHIHSDKSDLSNHTLLKRYVIENKVKSIPTAEQLIGYSEKLNAEMTDKQVEKMKALRKSLGDETSPWAISVDKTPKATCLLTTLVELDAETLHDWDQKHLLEVATGIEKVAQDEGDWYHRALIHDYAKLLKNLSELIREGLTSKEYNFSSTQKGDDLGDFQRSLAELRVLDIYRKSRAAGLMNYLRKPLEEAFGAELTIRQSFNNGYATCSFYFKEGDDPKTEKRIGIQIQGSQYRYYAEGGEIKEIFSGKAKGQRLEAQPKDAFNLDIVNMLKSEKWFISKEEREDSSSMQNEWCGYSPAFLYQYTDMPSKKGDIWSYEKIKDKLIHDLENAQRLLSQWR